MHRMDEGVNSCPSGTNRDNVPWKALEGESRWRRDTTRYDDAALAWLCAASIQLNRIIPTPKKVKSEESTFELDASTCTPRSTHTLRKAR
jgi:hypothetical protein